MSSTPAGKTSQRKQTKPGEDKPCDGGLWCAHGQIETAGVVWIKRIDDNDHQGSAVTRGNRISIISVAGGLHKWQPIGRAGRISWIMNKSIRQSAKPYRPGVSSVGGLLSFRRPRTVVTREHVKVAAAAHEMIQSIAAGDGRISTSLNEKLIAGSPATHAGRGSHRRQEGAVRVRDNQTAGIIQICCAGGGNGQFEAARVSPGHHRRL